MSVRAIVAGVVLALLFAGPVRAADRGVNIAWDACGPTGALSKSFGCKTNEGEAVLHVSFMLSDLDASRGPFYAYTASMAIYTTPPATLPDWWQFGSSGCRAGMLACTFAPDGDTACLPIPGMPDTSWMFYYDDGGYLVVHAQGAILGGDPVFVELGAGVEYSLCRLTIKYVKSTGADSCSGCSTPARIAVWGIYLVPVGSGPGADLETPLRQQYVDWSGSTVPVRRTSWGLIKGLYR